MATNIDPGSVRLTLVSSDSFTAGWFWASQGDEIWFFDAPPDRPSGTWAIGISTGNRRFVGSIWGDYSPSNKYVLVRNPDSYGTSVHDRATRTSWFLADTGEGLVVSPDESAVAFAIRRWGPYDLPWLQPTDIYWMGLDGHGRTAIARIIGGVLGWRSDGQVLVAGKDTLDEPVIVRAVSNAGEIVSDWVLGTRVRDLRLSTNGRRLAFAVVHGDPETNGQFAIDLFTGRRGRLPEPASVRWMPDESGLLVIPSRRGQARSFVVEQLSFPPKGVGQPITDPRRHRIDLESFDWKISPSGSALAFRSARDLRLHSLTWRYPWIGEVNLGLSQS